MEVRVRERPSEAAAAWIARRLRGAVERRGAASLAVSGGSAAPLLFTELVVLEVPWEAVVVWQVDERIAPDGHRDRNLAQLAALPCRVRAMPVTARDLRAAARRYASGLPDRFDAVHLGLGADGHTASWPPGDPVAASSRAVEVTREFHGRRRMTLTAGVVNGARARMVLATGAGKARVVERWLAGDPTLPADRIRRSATTLFLDAAAASRLAQ